MKTYTRVDARHEKFIRSQLRYEGNAVGVVCTRRMSAILLRKAAAGA